MSLCLGMPELCEYCSKVFKFRDVVTAEPAQLLVHISTARLGRSNPRLL